MRGSIVGRTQMNDQDHSSRLQPARPETTVRGERLAARRARERRGPSVRVVHSVDSAATGRSWQLDQPVLQIGRDAGDGGLTLRDPQVSRLHLLLKWDPETNSHSVEDADSSNGTFLNGIAVESAALSLGDVVRIGDTLLVYDQDSMRDLQSRVERGAATGLTALLLGETGVGKEVFARRIHEQSGRQGRFVAVNCGALRPELIAAELFGHAKNAFSGAVTARPGLFLSAQDGTLLLDEIGELPIDLQATLLRAVQERKVRPVGSDREVSVDVRLIAATNVDLESAVEQGRFRQDLYARFSELVYQIPPLRERRADIVDLLHDFGDVRPSAIDADAMESLLLWDWPNNVRELKSLSRAFVALGPASGAVDLEFLWEAAPRIVKHMLERHESSEDQPADARESFYAALTRTRGNVTAAAQELGTSRMQVYRWMKQVGIGASRFR